MFVYDRPMDGFEHLNNKVECPRCKYTFFDIVLINELSTVKARCRHCGFTTDGIGGVQGHLEELVRSLLPSCRKITKGQDYETGI